jgi:capsular exopolysaccharide synthesis family protein
MNFESQPKILSTEEESIDLQNLFRVIFRFKWRIISLALIVSTLVTIILFSITPIYVAKATLLIEAEQANIVSIEEVYGLNSGKKEYFVTQLEILRSKHIASRVVDKLNLTVHPEFDPDQQPEEFSLISFIKDNLPFLPQTIDDQSEEGALYEKKEGVITNVMERLSIDLIKKTQLITITFESESPILAAQVANTLADVYIESHLEAKLQMTAKASNWLNERLSTLKSKLDDSENFLQAYQNKEELVDIGGVKSIEAKELQELNSQLSAARQLRKQNENIYKLVQSKNNNIRSLLSLPEILDHNLIQGVNETAQRIKTKVYELQGTYGPKHPVMIAAESELRSVNDNLAQQVELLVSGISNQFLTAKANEKTLQLAVKNKSQRFRELSTLDAKQKELKREVESNEQLYNAFFTRLKETKEVGEFQSANARLIDTATPPLKPEKPKKKIILVMSFLLCIGFGIGLAFLFEFLNDGIRSVDDIENKLKQRMLGLLPLQKTQRKQGLPLRHFFSKEEHVFSESIRTIRTSLLLLNIEHDAKIISVTSSVPGEGKTTVSINLSFALSQLERVLLIDADMRRPSIAKSFALPSYQTGLSNIISGTHSIEECLVKDEASGVDIITAGSLPPNPQELLASPDFAKLIDSVKDKYDRIVIDTPPTQAVSDAVLVSQHSQSLVYVVKADNTREKIIVSGLNRLLSAGVRVDGIVLNQVDLKQAAKYGEYTGYYDQYGYNNQVSPNDETNSNDMKSHKESISS